MKLGITGSRVTPTRAQLLKMAQFLNAYEPEEVHHGVCIGVDLAMHKMLGGFAIPVVLHPPENTKLMFDHTQYDTPINGIFDPLPYKARNRSIVQMSHVVIGFPSGEERSQPRSGTWATIRLAEQRGKLVAICWPDGRVTRW